jgi:hypothetical protein
MKKNKLPIIILSITLVIILIIFIYFLTSASSKIISLESQLQASQSQNIDLESQSMNLQSQLQTANLNVSTPAGLFDSEFHDLMQEHTFLLTETARRSTTSTSFNASLGALQGNMEELASLLAPVYGSNSSELVSLWTTKANLFINYSTSLKNNDSNANTYYNAAVAAYIPQVVTFWTTTSNPYPVISSTIIQPLLTQQLADVKATIDAWNSGNYALYYADLEVAYNQMGDLADVMAQAIISQNPQLFQQ